MRQEQGRRVGHLGQPRPFHREHADLVGAAEAVLHRAQDAVLVAALALEAQHRVDHMLEHARAGDGAVLGDVADEHDRGAMLLGEAHQLLRRGADLADRARRAFDQVGVHGLDGIDDQQRRRLAVAHRRQDVADRGRRGEPHRRCAKAQPNRAQPHLLGRFLARDIDDLACPRSRAAPRPGAATSTCRCRDRRRPASPIRRRSRRRSRGRIRRGRSAAARAAPPAFRARPAGSRGRRPADCAWRRRCSRPRRASWTSVFHSAQSAHCPCQRC